MQAGGWAHSTLEEGGGQDFGCAIANLRRRRHRGPETGHFQEGNLTGSAGPRVQKSGGPADQPSALPRGGGQEEVQKVSDSFPCFGQIFGPGHLSDDSPPKFFGCPKAEKP